MAPDPARALIALLEDERAALRAGRLEAVGGYGDRKQALMEALGLQPPDPATLARITRGAARNRRLLAAALSGLAEASARLASIRGTAEGFSAYGQDGRTARIEGATRPGFERRA